MRIVKLMAGLSLLMAGISLQAQIAGDVIGVHNLGPGSGSPVTGARPDSARIVMRRTRA